MIRSCYIKVEEDTSCSGQVGVPSRVEWMSEGKHAAALIVMSQGRGLGPGVGTVCTNQHRCRWKICSHQIWHKICNGVHFADTTSPWPGDTWQLHVINIHCNMLATTLDHIGFNIHLVPSRTMWGSRVQSILLAFIPQTDYGNEDKFRWIRINLTAPALCKQTVGLEQRSLS